MNRRRIGVDFPQASLDFGQGTRRFAGYPLSGVQPLFGEDK